jgi:DHA1 family multidrug resistance protein-like MFS transporter
MWLSAFCLLVLFFFLPETSSPNILYRRTKRLRKLTGDEKFTCEPEMQSQEMSPKDVSFLHIRYSRVLLLTNMRRLS